MMLGQYVLCIRSSLDSGESPRKIIAALERDHDARHRFVHGTYELRLARVTATCTAGDAGLLNAWMRAAERQVERERGQ